MSKFPKKIRTRLPKALFIGPYPPPYSGPELGMKLFLESDIDKKVRLRFLKTNIHKSNEKKAQLNVKTAVWMIAFYFKFIWALILFRPRVVYYPITPTQAGWIGRDAPCILLSRLFGARVIIHLRGSHLQLNMKRFSASARKLVRFACSHVALALVQANCLRNQFSGLVNDEKIRVLPQAIDCKNYNRLPTPPVDNSHPVVLFLGNLSYPKGYCDLVRAIPSVAAEVPSVRFVCCGSFVEGASGVFYDQLNGRQLQYESVGDTHEQISKSSFTDNYEWRGVVSGDEKMELLRGCAIVTLPSYSEGFSRALIEAMSVGKSIVYTPVGAHKEYIRDGVNGLMVLPGDSDQLAKSIVRLLTDDALRANIEECNYAYARQEFDISVISDLLVQLINEVTHGDD